MKLKQSIGLKRGDNITFSDWDCKERPAVVLRAYRGGKAGYEVLYFSKRYHWTVEYTDPDGGAGSYGTVVAKHDYGITLLYGGKRRQFNNGKDWTGRDILFNCSYQWYIVSAPKLRGAKDTMVAGCRRWTTFQQARRWYNGASLERGYPYQPDKVAASLEIIGKLEKQYYKHYGSPLPAKIEA